MMRASSSSRSTPRLTPRTLQDALFATNNYKAGQLIGQWAKSRLGDKAKDAKIATLDPQFE